MRQRFVAFVVVHTPAHHEFHETPPRVWKPRWETIVASRFLEGIETRCCRIIPEMTSAVSKLSVTMMYDEPHMLSPYTLERTAGCYGKVANVEGLLRMMVFQSRPGEASVGVADLLFTREHFQQMARVMGMPGL
jgi:hypothetical protein